MEEIHWFTRFMLVVWVVVTVLESGATAWLTGAGKSVLKKYTVGTVVTAFVRMILYVWVAGDVLGWFR